MRKRLLIVIIGVVVGLAGRWLFPPADKEASLPVSPKAISAEVAK